MINPHLESLQELRGIIRSLLLEGAPPPETFTRKSDSTTFAKASGPDVGNPRKPYKYTGTPRGGKEETLTFTDNADANAKIAKLTGTAAPAAAPGAKKSDKADGKVASLDSSVSFEKLNRTLVTYHDKNGLQLGPAGYNGKVINADKIPTEMTAKPNIASAATVAYLISVCESLQAKVNEAKSQQDKESFFTRWKNRKQRSAQISSIDQLYDETAWKALITSLKNSDSRPSGITPVLVTYINAVKDDVSQDPDGFARYISDLASALQTPGADAVAVSSGAAPTPAPAATGGDMSDLAPLKAFLTGKDSITGVKGQIDDKNVVTALVGFINKTLATSPTDRSFTDSSSTNELIMSALNGLQSAKKTSDLNAWKGIKHLGQEFPGTAAGLVQFLKFSYIMRAGDTAQAAASAMGYADPSSIYTPQDADSAFKAARIVGALSPVAYMTIKGPDGKIPKDARLVISKQRVGTTTAELQNLPGTGRDVFVTTFTADYPDGAALVFGKTKGQSGNAIVDYDGPTSKTIVDAGMEQGIVLTLQIGDNVYVKEGAQFTLGSVITFTAGDIKGAGSASAAGPDFVDLAGMPAGVTDVRGVSQEGPIQFKFRNIYPDREGRLQAGDIDATLDKKVSMNRDRFTISVTPANNDPSSFILVPVPIKQSLQEGAHWTLKLLDTGASKKQSVVLVPLTAIEYNFKGNKIGYGESYDNLTTVSITPYEGALGADEGLNVKTVGQVLQDPELELTQDDIDAAVRNYLVSDKNPIGGPMLSSGPLHNTMNTYRRATRVTF
jgi:hypothetical protein